LPMMSRSFKCVVIVTVGSSYWPPTIILHCPTPLSVGRDQADHRWPADLRISQSARAHPAFQSIPDTGEVKAASLFGDAEGFVRVTG